jgi:hypothetical protein
LRSGDPGAFVVVGSLVRFVLLRALGKVAIDEDLVCW